MSYIGYRHCLAGTSPLRSVLMYRTVESVLGPSRQVKIEAELRIAQSELAGHLSLYAAERAALGKANRRPVNWSNGTAGCRRYHQAEALRTINARRKVLRAIQARVTAAEAAVASLTPADAYASPYLAELDARAAAQPLLRAA